MDKNHFILNTPPQHDIQNNYRIRRRYMRKRLLSMLLVLSLMVALLPASARWRAPKGTIPSTLRSTRGAESIWRRWISRSVPLTCPCPPGPRGGRSPYPAPRCRGARSRSMRGAIFSARQGPIPLAPGPERSSELHPFPKYLLLSARVLGRGSGKNQLHEFRKKL